MIKKVKFTTIPVTNQKRAVEFYTEKVGFSVFTDQPFSDEQRWIELRVAGCDTHLVLFTPDEHRSWIGRFSNVSFACDDLERTYEELRQRGVEFTEPPTRQDWGSYALFRDPDGTTFCLSDC